MILTRPRSTPAERERAYARKRTREAARQRQKSADEREIAPLPAVADPKRRAKAVASFRKFCELYFAKKRFTLKWGQPHLEVIADFERVVTQGGVVALAMPRGSGKSALAEVAVLWAVLCHAHPFVMLIAANKGKAEELLLNVRAELETNELLAGDFPEVCYPIARLEGVNQRRMLFEGQPILTKLRCRELLLAEVPGRFAGAVIRCTGLLGGDVRGASFTQPNGQRVRPTLFIADDPQTRQSAQSHKQSETRERILAGDVLHMKNPDREIAGIVTCTVIRQGDMADRVLDRQLHPEYQGRRYKMVEGLPPDKDLVAWREYGRVRNQGMQQGDAGKAGRAHYRQHQKVLEHGLTHYWPARVLKGELNSLHSALNLYTNDRTAFYAECQNDPAAAESLDEERPTPRGVLSKLTQLPRGLLPIWTRKLVAFVDVQQKLLFYGLVAFGEDFSASVVDYGTFPDQGLNYFTLRSTERTIEHAFRAAGLTGGFEAMLWWALAQVEQSLLKPQRWQREDGTHIPVERLLIDSGWGESTTLIYEYCRRSQNSAILLPSKGVGVSAKNKPMTEWTAKPHEPAPGLHWMLTTEPQKRAVRLLQYDTNWWKTFVCHRAATPPGGRGNLSIFGVNAEGHRNFLDHLTAEVPIKTTGRGRVVWDWTCPPGVDNHWWDCVVGAYVGASLLGCNLEESRLAPPKQRWTADDIARIRAGRDRS